jgi:multidrug efflux system outer membrane protein
MSLTGFLGVQSRALSDLISGPARMASASLGAAAPIFNAGRTRANVRLTEAIQREALVNYERAIYSAFRDVSDSLAAHTKTSDQRAQQERLVEALRESSRLSDQRYQGGLDSYLPVLDAQRNLFQASSSSRGFVNGSSHRSSICIARWAAAGHREGGVSMPNFTTSNFQMVNFQFTTSNFHTVNS